MKTSKDPYWSCLHGVKHWYRCRKCEKRNELMREINIPLDKIEAIEALEEID